MSRENIPPERILSELRIRMRRVLGEYPHDPIAHTCLREMHRRREDWQTVDIVIEYIRASFWQRKDLLLDLDRACRSHSRHSAILERCTKHLHSGLTPIVQTAPESAALEEAAE